MFQKPVLRLMIALGLPIASAVVVEQLPKSGVAEVPFAFQVNEQTLPPGNYLVRQTGRERSVCIQNERETVALTECVTTKRKFGKAEQARLVFDNREGRYFLTEIWFEADGRGLILREPQTKPDARRELKNPQIRYVRFQR